MQKHIKRVGGGLVATAVFAVGLLVTDIPKTLEQMDRSFAFIAQGLGYGSPPRHFISDAWGHPWVILLAFVAVFALGVAVSSGIERLYGRFRARPPTGPQPLYLSVTPPPPNGLKRKFVLVVWDPTTAMLEYRGDGPFVGWPPTPPHEHEITMNLFNAGPDDVRHIEVSWSLPGSDLDALVKESDLFGDCLVSFGDGRLRLQRNQGGSSSPILEKLDAFPMLPLLRSGETLQITAPTGVTLAWTVAVLATLKIKCPPDAGALIAGGMLEFIENLERVPDLRVDLNYFVGGEKHHQGFVMVGWGRPAGSGSCMSRTPNAEGTYNQIPDGVTGMIEGVQVIRNE